MADIVDDLRWEAAHPVDGGPAALLELAADEIETLRLELKAYRAVVNCRFCDEQAERHDDEGTPLCNEHFNATYRE